MRLTGIITQGASRMGTAEYIKAYKVASSLDGNTYTILKVQGQWRDKVKEEAAFGIFWNKKNYSSMSTYFVSLPQVFVGNTDNDSTKTNLFDPSIVAQYIRIIPVVCRKACTLRMELVGCELNGKQIKAASWAFRRFDWVVKSMGRHTALLPQSKPLGQPSTGPWHFIVQLYSDK